MTNPWFNYPEDFDGNTVESYTKLRASVLQLLFSGISDAFDMLNTALTDTASAAHTHPIADVVDLQSALDDIVPPPASPVVGSEYVLRRTSVGWAWVEMSGGLMVVDERFADGFDYADQAAMGVVWSGDLHEPGAAVVHLPLSSGATLSTIALRPDARPVAQQGELFRIAIDVQSPNDALLYISLSYRDGAGGTISSQGTYVRVIGTSDQQVTAGIYTAANGTESVSITVGVTRTNDVDGLPERTAYIKGVRLIRVS